MAYIQELNATDHSTAKNINQTMYVSSRGLYCDLVFLEKNQNRRTDAWVRAKDQRILYPGRVYCAQVSLSPNRSRMSYEEDSPELFIDSEISIELICTENTISIKRPINTLSRKKKADFLLTIPEHCPKCEVTFTLYYTEHSAQARKTAIAKKIQLQGTYTLADSHFLESSHVDLTAHFPDHVAILNVTQINENTFSFRCFNRTTDPLEFSVQKWNPEKLADIFDRMQRNPCEDIIEIASKFAPHAQFFKLIRWYKSLHPSDNQRICVVIDEDNNLEIPWEMLEIGDRCYLGTDAVVVHWREMYIHEDLQKLEVKDICHHGSLLAYFENKGLGADTTYLERHSTVNISREIYIQLDDLKKTLQATESLHRVSLIYLGCYGHNTMSVDERRHLFQEIKQFRFARIKKHIGLRPVVFVNASDSARFDDSPNGPMDEWLKRLAQSYVGTRGPIGAAYASLVAQRIFALAPVGLNIAELLRQLRAEAVKKVYENEEIWEDFLYAFMYVYYGNPLATVQLISIEKTEENR